MKEIYVELFVQMIIKGRIIFTEELPEKFVSGSSYYTLKPNYNKNDIFDLENQIQQIIISMINNTCNKPRVFHP
jgi:hypothetical protein